MRFVELKSEEQLDMQSLHRAPSRLVNALRTLINQFRAILLERGHAIDRASRMCLAHYLWRTTCRRRS
jgi:transposase